MPQEKQSFILYCDARRHIGMMSDAQAGQLFRLLLDFAAEGRSPAPAEIGDGLVAMAFSFLSAQIGRDQEKYRQTCEKRREAGRKGAEVTNRKRWGSPDPTGEAGRQRSAKSPEHDPDPVPESVPDPHPDPVPESEPDPHPESVPGPAPEAGEERTTRRTPEFFPGEGTGTDPAEPMATLDSCLAFLKAAPETPEALWARLGLGEGALPALTQLLDESRAKGIEEGVLAEVIRRTAEHQPKAPLAYLRSSLDQCAARGCKTLDQFQAAHSGSGRGLRVDRPTPSGHDFLADAATRPFRRKRRDAAAEPVYEKLP